MSDAKSRQNVETIFFDIKCTIIFEALASRGRLELLSSVEGHMRRSYASWSVTELLARDS